MGYYRDLALELRRRGLSEAEVGQQLRATAEIAGDHPGVVFGTASEYAAGFPPTAHRSWGQRVALSGFVTGVLLLVTLLARLVNGSSVAILPWLMLVVTVIVACALVGYWLDRRIADPDIRDVDKRAPGSVRGDHADDAEQR